MRHRGVHVCNFFLGDKEGSKEFNSEVVDLPRLEGSDSP